MASLSVADNVLLTITPRGGGGGGGGGGTDSTFLDFSTVIVDVDDGVEPLPFLSFSPLKLDWMDDLLELPALEGWEGVVMTTPDDLLELEILWAGEVKAVFSCMRIDIGEDLALLVR